MSKQVIVYTTTDCVECSMVKQLLTQLEISYETRDVSTDPQYQQEIEGFGFLGVPVTVIAGQAVKGYRPEEIVSLLKL